ncbi:hypothetical protein, partial [Aeromonas hydrophila]|uniref:hypothetical protein n=1 Tax=Aeromonas hydrophila TaxID=644 RepID=UPI0036D7BA7A
EHKRFLMRVEDFTSKFNPMPLTMTFFLWDGEQICKLTSVDWYLLLKNHLLLIDANRQGHRFFKMVINHLTMVVQEAETGG